MPSQCLLFRRICSMLCIARNLLNACHHLVYCRCYLICLCLLLNCKYIA